VALNGFDSTAKARRHTTAAPASQERCLWLDDFP
jgi:hypothetical protein